MNPSLERLRGAVANNYTIDRELGSGGMATVYLAQDGKHERLVALKVLHPVLAASLGLEIRVVEQQLELTPDDARACIFAAVAHFGIARAGEINAVRRART